MPAHFQIPLDLPDVEITSVRDGEQGELILEVKSTPTFTYCRYCQRKITAFHGHDRPVRLQHLPILERKVFIELRPKRYVCRDCDGHPTTTQQPEWYSPNSPHTKALDQWLLKRLMNATVSDVSRCGQVSYDAVEGCIDRYVDKTLDWKHLAPFTTLGLDEIALRKGHRNFVCVVTALDAAGQVRVLAILSDRRKQTVLDFLLSIPTAFKERIERVCSDMYDGFINAVREALPHADIVIDRFHVAKHYNKGVDDLRKATLKTLRQDLPKETYDTFKGSMWAFRRHFWDLTEEQRERLVLLFAYAPDLRQAWLLRHELFLIYQAHYTPEEAAVDFDRWIQKVRASGLTCFDAFIQQLNASRSGILAYFNGRYTSGFVEGLNNRLKVIKRRCFGLLDAGKLFQRIQVDLQERTGCLSLWQNTTSCG